MFEADPSNDPRAIDEVALRGQLYNVFELHDGRIVSVRDFIRRDDAVSAAAARQPPWTELDSDGWLEVRRLRGGERADDLAVLRLRRVRGEVRLGDDAAEPVVRVQRAGA